MKLDLRDIIEMPGASKAFACEVPAEERLSPSVLAFVEGPHAEGAVVNTAGALTLTGDLTARMTCVCDRCGKTYETEKRMALSLPLAADLTDEENPDIFPIENDEIDLDEILETSFLLDMDAKYLCREDCKGLCPNCGADLNLGPCGCKREVDPRMAVLGQLLDDT